MLNYSGTPFNWAILDETSSGYTNNMVNESNDIFKHPGAEILDVFGNLSTVLIEITQFLLPSCFSNEKIWNLPWIGVFFL